MLTRLLTCSFIHLLCQTDPDLINSLTDRGNAPNLLKVTVVSAADFPGDKNIEAFALVSVGNLRKETKVAKKSNAPGTHSLT